ncbi:MAG: hypothetical protein AAB597_01345 [Patescibacteria group bacterium]
MNPEQPPQPPVKIPTGIHYAERMYTNPEFPGIKFYSVHVSFGPVSELMEVGTDGSVKALTGGEVVKEAVAELFRNYSDSVEGKSRLNQLELEANPEVPE